MKLEFNELSRIIVALQIDFVRTCRYNDVK